MRLSRAVWLAAAAICCTGYSLGVQLPVRIYTTADGLPRNIVGCIVPDSRGYVWFCTVEGLSRFDGHEFRNYGIDRGLPDSTVLAILETRWGTYLVGTRGGLAVLNPDSATNTGRVFQTYTPGGERYVNALYEDSRGRIWCGAGPWVFVSETRDRQLDFHRVELPGLTPHNETVNDFVEDNAGNIWIATFEGLYRVPPTGTPEHYVMDPPYRIIYSLARDTSGTVWAGTHSGLCRLLARPDASGRIVDRIYSGKDGLAPGQVFAILPGRAGMWVGTSLGLSRWTGDTRGARSFVRYGLREASMVTGALSLAYDHEGNTWVGSSDGVRRISHSGLLTYSTEDGLASRNVVGFVEEPSAGILALTLTPGSLHLNRPGGTKFHSIRPAFPKPIRYFGWPSGQAAVLDHEGAWWLPTADGLYHYSKIRAAEQLAHTLPDRVFTKADGLPGNEIFRLFEDSRGDMWIATLTANTLSRWERSSNRIVQELPPGGAIVTGLAEAKDGTIWVAGGTLLFRHRVGARTEVVQGPSATAVYFETAGGRLWVGGHDGLYWSDDAPSPHPGFHQVLTASTRCITEDALHRIYACTGGGIVRLDTHTGAMKRYTTSDGLVRGEFKAAFKDHQGRLWFGTELGLSVMEPERDEFPEQRRVLITGVRAGAHEMPVLEMGETLLNGLRVKPGEDSLEVRYTAVAHAPGEMVRYEYKLEGSQEEWSPPTAQQTLTFAGLGAGTYRLLIRVAGMPGDAASVNFTVLAPFWRTWWFWSVSGLAVFGAFHGFYRMRMARITELARVRSTIAMDLHDDIGASLSQIAVMSEVARRAAGGNGMLSDIANTSRALVDSMSDIVWATDPQNDRIETLVERMRWFGSETLTAAGVCFHFNAGEVAERTALDPETRRNILLIFKEAMNNIVRHAGATEVLGTVEIEHGSLLLRLRDDGRGFDPDRVRRGHGLFTMHERARKLHASLQIRTATGTGTELVLRAPLKLVGGVRSIFAKIRTAGSPVD